MSDAPTKPASNSHPIGLTLALGVIGSLVAAAIWYAGSWLVDHQVPNDTALQFSFSESRVGKATSWYIRLHNSSNYAFEVQFKAPASQIIRAEFSPPATVPGEWTGTLLKESKLEALILMDDSRMELSSHQMSSLVSVSYYERDERTGKIEKRAGQLREAGLISFPRALLAMMWFILPAIVVGAISWLAWIAYRRLKKT